VLFSLISIDRETLGCQPANTNVLPFESSLLFHQIRPQTPAANRMAIRDIPSNVITRVQSLLNTVVKPDTRQQLYTNIGSFANEQPILAVRTSYTH
jgi:hypothetical protein